MGRSVTLLVLNMSSGGIIFKLYGPVNRIKALLHQEIICFRKMFATKKSIVSGKWRWMSRFENLVAFFIDQILFLLCKFAPQKKHNIFSKGRYFADNAVGEQMPANF